MNAHQFDEIVSKLFLSIEHWLEQENDEIDFESNQERLKVEVNNCYLILSKQSPLEEVWLATPLGAYHFRYLSGSWLTNKQEALIEVIADTLSKKGGVIVNPENWKLEE